MSPRKLLHLSTVHQCYIQCCYGNSRIFLPMLHSVSLRKHNELHHGSLLTRQAGGTDRNKVCSLCCAGHLRGCRALPTQDEIAFPNLALFFADNTNILMLTSQVWSSLPSSRCLRKVGCQDSNTILSPSQRVFSPVASPRNIPSTVLGDYKRRNLATATFFVRHNVTFLPYRVLEYAWSRPLT